MKEGEMEEENEREGWSQHVLNKGSGHFLSSLSIQRHLISSPSGSFLQLGRSCCSVTLNQRTDGAVDGK